MIRLAQNDDIDELVELCREFHNLSRFRSLGFHAEKVREMFEQSIPADDRLVIAYERDGKVVGFFAGMVMQHWCSEGVSAHEMAFYIQPAYRGGLGAAKMINAYIHWAEEMGAIMTMAGITCGINDITGLRLYERLGFKKSGTLLILGE